VYGLLSKPPPPPPPPPPGLRLCSWLLHRFGVGYGSSCEVDLSDLLSQLDYSSNGPRFYDPYIMQVRKW